MKGYFLIISEYHVHKTIWERLQSAHILTVIDFLLGQSRHRQII